MHDRRERPPPGLIEVIGPAGAGKSALAEAYCAREPVNCLRLSLWGLPDRFLLAGAVALLKTLGATALSRRPVAPVELAQMTRIEALRLVVEHRRTRHDSVILMDEGWVFGMAWLEVFHPAAGEPARERWRQRQIEHWAKRLDTVVLLDAEDSVLAQRIRTRAKPHPVRTSTDAEIRDFTARFRHGFERVVADIQAAGAVAALSLRTDRALLSDSVARLHAALAGIRPKGEVS